MKPASENSPGRPRTGRNSRKGRGGKPQARGPLLVGRSHEVADRLHSAAIHLLRRVRKEDLAMGLSGARLSALSVLVFGGAASLGELARAEQVTPPTMSRIVSALVADGLVTRTNDTRDRRSVRLEATRRGAEMLSEGRRRRVARLAADLDTLDPNDLRRVAEAVDVLRGLLGTRRNTPTPTRSSR